MNHSGAARPALIHSGVAPQVSEYHIGYRLKADSRNIEW